MLHTEKLKEPGDEAIVVLFVRWDYMDFQEQETTVACYILVVECVFFTF